MSDATSIPERMRNVLLENGYETPTNIPTSRTESESDFDHRKRIIFGNDHHMSNNLTNSSNINAFLEEPKDENSGKQVPLHKIGIRVRIGCYTWTWFTLTMATGGIANVLHSIPWRPAWLNGVGIFFMILNLVFFIANCIMISLRFKFNPGSFRAAFTNQSESLFIPACIVSVGIILTNISQYGLEMERPWLQSTMEILFWMYAAVSMLASSGIYLILWSTQSFPIHDMTPIWIFPAYPLLIVATFASNLIDAMPDANEAKQFNTAAMTFGAIMLQGTGFLVSLNIYGAFIYRLMTQKLPRDTLKPGIFVSVGPSGFTAAGLVHLGNVLSSKVFPNGFMGNQDAAFFLKLVLDLIGICLWGLCIWFFLISIGAHWKVLWPKDPKHQIHFNMTWYSFIFPNTSLVTATQAIGRTFNANAINIVGTAMAGILVLVWLFVFCVMLKALLAKKLLWPEQESKGRTVDCLKTTRA